MFKNLEAIQLDWYSRMIFFTSPHMQKPYKFYLNHIEYWIIFDRDFNINSGTFNDFSNYKYNKIA